MRALIAHTDQEKVWSGHPVKHPDEVWDVFHQHGYIKKPWDTFRVLCDEPMCLQMDHLKLVAPTRLEYPARICVYCGRPAGTRDHLMSRTATGDAERRHVLTVPACGQCNSILGDRGIYTIDGRRAHVQKRLADKYWKVLGYEGIDAQELSEYGPGLRPVMEGAKAERDHLEARLMWPDDPHYDIRYLQHSGYEHPMSVGLLEYEPNEAAAERRRLVSEYSDFARRRRAA